MSDAYKLNEEDRAYYLTMTVVGWIDVFTRLNYKLTIVDALKFCQHKKGLVIFGWCLMSNHIHLIARSEGNYNLSEIIRDLKKYTSKKVIQLIIDGPESRREWMLANFQYAGKHLKRITNYKFWQDGNQAKIIYNPSFFYEKLQYIHDNPVRNMIVEKPEDYIFSSARNYAGLDSMLEVVLESSRLITY